MAGDPFARLLVRFASVGFEHDPLARPPAPRIHLVAEPHDGPTLIVTHHVPHLNARHPRYGLNALTPAFCSDCGDLIGAAASAGAVAWIFGHHHWSHCLEMHGLPLLTAQPGYPGEDTGWIGPGVLTL